MENWEQYGIVFSLGKALRDRRSWAGETHIQKAGYFLQEVLRVPLGCNFILYKHGPFSFDLRETIAAMESVRLIAWEPRPPYGPSFLAGDHSRLLGSVASDYKAFIPQINYLADRFTGKSVAELERLGTALYVTLDREVPLPNRAEKIVELKPHLDLGAAREALDSVDAMIQEVNQQNLVVAQARAYAG